jgi:hypothetical protein
VAARVAHNHEVAGSSPAPATKLFMLKSCDSTGLYFMLMLMNKNKEAGFITWIIPIVIVGLLIVAVFVWSNHTKTTNKINKMAIDSELKLYVAPSSCKKSFERYNQGDGLDSTPTWQLDYNCQNALQAVHNEIITLLRNKGAQIKRDDFSGGTASLGSLNACSNSYFASYYLSDLANPAIAKNSSGTKIDFSLQKSNC